jgi:putative membrane protein
METNWVHLGHLIFQCLIFSAIGLAMFGIAFVMFEKLIKVSIRKEIVEDQNTSLGIAMAGMMIAIAIIVAAAISG